MDQSEGKSPRRGKAPDGFCPSRREAARREQAERDKGLYPLITASATFIPSTAAEVMPPA